MHHVLASRTAGVRFTYRCCLYTSSGAPDWRVAVILLSNCGFIIVSDNKMPTSKNNYFLAFTPHSGCP